MLDTGLVLARVIMLLIRLVLMIKMEHPAAQLWFLPHKKKKKKKKIVSSLQLKKHVRQGPREVEGGFS